MPGGLAALEPAPIPAAESAPPRRRVHRRWRQARSPVGGGAVGVAGLNVCLAAVVNYWPGLRAPLFDLPAEPFRQRVATANNRPITAAFLGSSRTGGGIRPAVVEEMVTAET